MAKRGRPSKAGARNKKGRLVVLVDRGNDRVQARAERFAKCQGGKASEQVSDGIGRLWAVGLLDGTDYDAAILRDAGRRYAALYWSYFADMAPRIGQAERRSKNSSTADADPRGELFQRLDTAAHRRGHDAYAAMQSVCVDEWWFPDVDAAWAARLIEATFTRDEPDIADLARLTLAKQGLCALLDGPKQITDMIPLCRLTAA